MFYPFVTAIDLSYSHKIKKDGCRSAPTDSEIYKMIIDCFATDKFAVKELAERTGDEVVSLSDVLDGEVAELFSQKPFVLAINYDFCFDYDVIARFFETAFNGSKVLYCVYIGGCSAEKSVDLAKKIARKKRFVLFGSDCIDCRALSKADYFKKLDDLGTQIRNSIPLSSACGTDFPYGEKKRLKIAEV